MACRYYAQATVLDPGNSIYHDNFGFALNQLGRAREAEDEFLKAIRADSLDPYPRVHLASLYLAENRLAEAENVALMAFRLDSNSVGGVSVMVDLFTMEGKYDSMRFYNEKLKVLLAQQAKK
jgi:tetratricopeptide (TPR) repeat protein